MTAHAVSVSAQSFQSRAYKTGIYIFCGKELPKKFSYLIEKKTSTDIDWKVIAELKSPKSESACKGALLSLPQSIAAFTNPEDAQIVKLWQQIKSAQSLDSLYAFGMDPRFQTVAGCAYLDDGITSKNNYLYRISKIEKDGTKSLFGEDRIPFPSNSYNGILKPIKFKPGEGNISITYSFNDTVNTAGVKLYRTQYQENNFIEVPSHPFFTNESRKQVVRVTDPGTAEGVTYTYIAVPFDALGNEGEASDSLNIYNLLKPSNVGLIQKFSVTPKEGQQGIELEWKLKTDKGIGSIEIYRSKTYEGNYIKLTSLSPKETKYFDEKYLSPSIAYYYYILINNGYGNSLPSARVPAILKGNKKNIFPPQNLSVARNGNIVKLTFTKLENDTRGYYIYRSNSYTGPLVQLSRMLLSTDSMLTYIDTLPQSKMPEVYSYAVAGVNTSYNISQLSDRKSIQTSGNNLPIPDKMEAILRSTQVFISWKDVSKLSRAVTGYNLYRSIAKEDGKDVEPPIVIAKIMNGSNVFIDKNIIDGTRYHYYVQSVGLDKMDVSKLSMKASILIPENIPMQPGKVIAFTSQNRILIKWDLPSDSIIKRVRVYRAITGQKAILLKELSSTDKEFQDSAVELNNTYYYFITTVSSKNKESKPTDPVSAKIRG